MGNVFHSAIERYSKKVQASGRGWTGLAKKEQEQLVAESVEEAVAGYGNSVLYSSARNEYMIIRMTKAESDGVGAYQTTGAGRFRAGIL